MSHAKLISSSKIFYKELKTIKQTLINNGFSTYIVDEQIKMFANKINTATLHPINKHLSNFFTATIIN